MEERNSRGEDSGRERVRRLEERKEIREAKWLEGECAEVRERRGARLTEKNCGYEREKLGTVAIKGNENEDVGGRR